MKRAIFVFLTTVILLVSARTMIAMCTLAGADMTVVCTVEPDGTETCWWHYIEYWDCSGGDGGTTGGGNSPPPDGGTTSPGPQPQISIVSISDENPGNPMLQVSTSNVDYYDLYINGGFQNSYSGSTTNVILPSLDPRSGQFSRNSTLDLMAYNNNGQANASMSVDRPSSQPSTQQGMYVRYYDTSEQGGVIRHELNMTRSLTTLVIYTNYSVPTSGARNGRVFHWSVEDVIGWDGFYPTPSWGSFYYMSSLPVASFWDERPCGARFAGPANQSGLCADPTSFAFDGQSSATARIPDNGFSMGDPVYPTYIVPNDITVNP